MVPASSRSRGPTPATRSAALSASGPGLPSAAECQRGDSNAPQYHRSRRDVLRAVVVGRPRHELDHAARGNGDHAGGGYCYRDVRALGLLLVTTSAARQIAKILAGCRVPPTSGRDAQAAAW